MPDRTTQPLQLRSTKDLPLADLRVSEFNTRLEPNPEGVEELTESIKTIGLQNPLLVRPTATDPNVYEVVSGSRRLQALRTLGYSKAPCRVDPHMDDEQALLASLHENLKRGDITAQELSRAIQRMMDGGDPSWSDIKKRRWVAEQLGWHYTSPQGRNKPDANRVRDAILMGEFQKMLPGTVIKFRQRGDSKKPTIAWSTAKQVRDALMKSRTWETLDALPPDDRTRIVKEFADTYSGLPATKRGEFLRLMESNPSTSPKDLVVNLQEQERKTQVLAFRLDISLWERIDEYATRVGLKRSEAVKRLVEKALEVEPRLDGERAEDVQQGRSA